MFKTTTFGTNECLNCTFNRMSVRTIEEAERSETDPEDDSSSHILDVKDYEAIFMPNRSCKLTGKSHIALCM